MDIELKKNCPKKWKYIVETHNERKNLPVPTFVKEKVKKIAISILITKDPSRTSGFLDSAGSFSHVDSRSKIKL